MPQNNNVGTEYQILVAGSPKKLVTLVEEYIRNGWKCQGGVCHMVDRGNYKKFCQAVIRHGANGV